MDTRNKRASALGVGLAFALVLPAPDGTVEQADRQQTAYSYAGISADSPIPFVPDVDRTFAVKRESRTFRVAAESRAFAVAADQRTFIVPGD